MEYSSVTDRILMLVSKWPIYNNGLINFCKFEAIIPLQLMLKMAHLFPDQCPAVYIPPCGDIASSAQPAHSSSDHAATATHLRKISLIPSLVTLRASWVSPATTLCLVCELGSLPGFPLNWTFWFCVSNKVLTFTFNLNAFEGGNPSKEFWKK